MSLTSRVVARYLNRQADLSPPIGHPGGPCQVVDRVEKNIRTPHLRQHLIEEVEMGGTLSNPDAAKVYRTEIEHGKGLFKTLVFGPHAQYRMDLRSVTIPQVRAALEVLSRKYFDLKSRGGPDFQELDRALQRERFVWTAPKLGLTVVFVLKDQGSAHLITAYWEGEPDPKATPGECEPG